MEIEEPTDKKKPSEDDSSSEENEVGQITQKIELKLDLVEANCENLKKKDNLWFADKIFLSLWGNSAIFLLSIVNEWVSKGKATKVGMLNFSKAKQKALAQIFSMDSSYFIIFGEEIKETDEYDLPAFISKTFAFDPKNFEFVLFDNIAQALLRKMEKPCNVLRFISSNHHSVENYQNLQKVASPLEVGNHIEGVVADLVAFCELNGLKANVFVGVKEENWVNSDDVRKFQAILPVYKVLDVEVPKKNVSDLVKKAQNPLISYN